ncbi:hypothetical protein GUITHDRAFT_115688 [Guillardia theta CCMP2712]|uniref:C-type lectin domain-containing protein n=1 Tax=Guillardia theta (strain CCMP2712) TaxID=905079 RepID=L1IQN7_GUITC|nr:hypothetical protein GUITHDRAFT_115688 [Guillardia theta CCMP2712]EKX38135.1 hypothetical protein GUITHDRAFT_115688 [Guillardia theta CCMP2712]|eukprot:XP_005825115.1 hypothetical protein GUITHDRAFT_115688 [Guillardia theta CCMP2712]
MTLRALEWEIRSIKQNLSATLDELRSLNTSVSSLPQLPWGNLTSSVVRCSLPYNWSQIINKEEEGRVQIGGLGHLMQIDKYEVWVCDYDNRCVQQEGDALCFVFDEVKEIFLPWGLDSELLLTQQGPFQPDLAISNILAKLKVLEQEIRSGGCGGSCMTSQQVQQLLDQYYLEPGYLWSAGSFSQCSSLCGSGVAKRSITCISKLLEQVEDFRCSNRSKPFAEVPCANYSQCSFEWEVGAYSECLTGCGQGSRRRSVSCRRSDGVVVEIVKCLGSAPVQEEPCSNFSFCSYRWASSSWEACSSTCGSGLQYRSVMCVRSDGVEVEDGMCETGSKPRIFQACTGASGCNYTLMNECAMNTDNCATHASCFDTYASFECSCQPGYVGSGTVCEDENECVKRTGLCDATTMCVNTEGSFQCLCKEGFYLDVTSPSSSCVACSAGLYTSGLGQTSCSLCAPSYYGSADSGCNPCPAGSSSAFGSQLVTDCKCQFGFSGSISNAGDSCKPIFSNVEEQTRWLRLGASGMSCTATCAAEGKTCVSSAINQIDDEEAIRSAVKAASIASDRRIRAAMTEPQKRPEGLHFRMSAGARKPEDDGLQDLTANSGHVRRQRYVEYGATSFPLVPKAESICCSITQEFYVDLPVELSSSRMIDISVTVEGSSSGDNTEAFSLVDLSGWRGACMSDVPQIEDPMMWSRIPLQSLNCRIRAPLQEALADGGGQIGPIAISYSSISYNGRSTWRISVGQLEDETEEPLRPMSDGKLKYVNGSFQDVVTFPPMSIPGPFFTLCSISRYNDNFRNRILQAAEANFYHGHRNGGREQASYNGTWNLAQDLSPTAEAWVVLCGQNYQEGKFFLNGVEYQQSAASLSSSLQLTINYNTWDFYHRFFLESSDWALSEVAIWQGALREDELRAVSSHLMHMLSDGSDVLYNQTLNVSCDKVFPALNGFAPFVSASECFFPAKGYHSTCDASFNGASRVCVCSAPCLENFYGHADACIRCPFYSLSPPGSSSIHDCSCDQGLMSPFASSSVEDCMCKPGSYGSAGNCSSCPALSTSTPGSTSIEDCFCLAGFGVKATGYSRQVTSPTDKCEAIVDEMFLAESVGMSCSEVCASKSLVCMDEAQPLLSNADLRSLSTFFSVPFTGEIVGTSNLDAPSYNHETGQAFLRYGSRGSCSATSSTNVRICRCTCADNQYGNTGSCLSCPANSSSSWQAQGRSSCICDSGYFFNASQECSPCSSGTYAKRMKMADQDFGRNGTMGWKGTEQITSCGRYGSVLGGLNELAEYSRVGKTFTGLCPHGFLYIRMQVLLIDFAQPVMVRLFVNRQEVWNQTISAISPSSTSECGQSQGDAMINPSMRLYHTEGYVEAEVQVDYVYWESSVKTFWGLKDFSVVVPCASSSASDCSMTSPLTQTCSEVTESGVPCMQSGVYLYVYYPDTWMNFSDAEAKCNQIGGGGGQVAYFPDGQTHDEVIAGLGISSDNWIGLQHSAGPQYDFKWVTNGPPSFTRWADGGPNDGNWNDLCVLLRDSLWYDVPCSSTYRVLCSYLAV